MRQLSIWLGLGLCALPAVAHAAPQKFCPGQFGTLAADGRMLNHLPYGQAAAHDLVTIPGFGSNGPCQIHRNAAPDLARLLADARGAGIVGLRGRSCFRSIATQRAVFCGKIGRAGAVERARASAPPGYSEHATGYTLDFEIPRPSGCVRFGGCVANTRAGRWLIAHAGDYGFEMSFPAARRQGVIYEPWHWRWVGTSASVPGAIAARATFARARTEYAADPAVRDRPAGFAPVAPPPLVGPEPHIAPLPLDPPPRPDDRLTTEPRGPVTRRRPARSRRRPSR